MFRSKRPVHTIPVQPFLRLTFQQCAFLLCSCLPDDDVATSELAWSFSTKKRCCDLSARYLPHDSHESHQHRHRGHGVDLLNAMNLPFQTVLFFVTLDIELNL